MNKPHFKMAKSASFSIGLLLNSFICFCQINQDDTWTDGEQFFYITFLQGNKLHFEGGNLHEGGSAFYCEKLTATKIKILGSRPDDEGFPGFGEISWTLEYKKIKDIEILIARDSSKGFKGFLLKIPQKINFEDFIIKNKTNFQLAGKYIIQKTKEPITFYPDDKRVSWNGKNKSYEFQTEYDMPTNVISISNKNYFYERSFKDLFLYEAKSETLGEYEKGKLLHKLILKENIQRNPDNLYGDYFLASTTPLTEDIIRFFSSAELKLIRNEIFARHGYIFADKQIRKYFETKTWYRPVTQDVSNRLSEIEQLNIEQLKRAERENNEL